MGKKKLDFLLESKIAVAFVVAILFVLGLILVAQGLINTTSYRDAVIHAVREKTGHDPVIKGNLSLSLVPMPTISIPGVELRDPNNEDNAPSLTVDMLRLDITLATLFSDRPQISKVTLEHPILTIIRGKNQKVHWDWLNPELLKAMVNTGSATPFTLSVTDGKIVYQNDSADKSISVDNIRADMVTGQQASLNSSFVAFGRNLRLTAARRNETLPTGIPFSARLFTDDKNSLRLQAVLDLSQDTPKAKGTFDLETEDLLSWIGPPQEDKGQLLDKVTRNFIKKEPTAQNFPFKLTGSMAEDGINLSLMDLKLEGLNSQGSGKAEWIWKEGQPSVTCTLDFSSLDFNQWNTLLDPLERLKSTTGAGAGSVEGPLPPDMKVNLALHADALQMGARPWKNATLAVQLSQGIITINRFDIELPGESSFTLFGIISQNTPNGLRFEGSLETSGKSLKQAMTVLDESAMTLPDTGFGAFYVHSNVFISSEQLRLSEADVKITDLHLNGGMVVYFDAHPHMEADIKLKDIDFDYFRDNWRKKESGPQDSFLTVGKGMDFSWLKKLHTTVDLNINVEGFTFLEHKGDSASFRLSAKEGEIGIYEVRFNYPTDTLEGSFSVNVKGELPLVNLIVNVNELNLGYFSTTPDAATPPEAVDAKDAQSPVNTGKKWSEELFDTRWMEGYNGIFDISVGRLHYKHFDVDRLKLQVKLENDVLTFKNCNFIYGDGRWSFLGSMYGGEVPGISLSFTLYSIELRDILKELTGRENISGKTSISGVLTTSGVNLLSWVSEADAKLALAGRGVVVQGLNLEGVIDAVNASRTTADVFNNVNLALGNGVSQMSVDGTLNVKGGVMRTPGVTLKSGVITGNLTGEVRLVPWTVDLSSVFQFPSLPSETIPTMTIQLTGPVNNPTLRTDTSSLEAYVASILVGKK